MVDSDGKRTNILNPSLCIQPFSHAIIIIIIQPTTNRTLSRKASKSRPNSGQHLVSDNDVVELAQLLALNPTVETLNLSSLTSLFLPRNQLGEHSGVAIGEALRNNTSLMSLDLQVNDCGGVGEVAIAKH